jgi:quercetin dioxygenase-like cupin family protein
MSHLRPLTPAKLEGMKPTYFILETLDWADDRASGLIPPEMLEEVRRRGGGGRKLLANGQGGYHSSYSTMPPGYRMDRHRHDYDEMVIVLEGGCTMDDGGTEMRAHDSVVLPAGFVHAFTCGTDGMKLLTIALGPFQTEMVP